MQAMMKLLASVTAASAEATSMAGMSLPPLPSSSSSSGSSSSSSSSSKKAAGSSNSSLRLLRLQVVEVLRGFSSLVSTTAAILLSLPDEKGPLRTMLLLGTVTGLGLLACMGLWQPPQDSKGLLSPSSSTSGQSEMLQNSILRCCVEAAGASEDDSDCDDSFARESADVSKMLLLHAAAIEQHDTLNMLTVLATVCKEPGEGSSAADVVRWINNGFARGRLEQLVQQHCHQPSPAAAAASVAAAAAAPVAAQHGTASSAAVAAEGAEGVNNGAAAAAQHRSAVWGLVLAVKPSVAAALHCSSLPAACRSYDAFERAVLGWPPQQEPAAADGAAKQGALEQGGNGLTQQHSDSSSSKSSSNTCDCGKPGYAFTTARLGWLELSPGMARAVCGDPVYVARLLQQLAQQGPPVDGVSGGGFELALQHVVEDLALLPYEYR
jgi:hypothetical protein